MTSPNEETTRRPIYSIPGLIEMEKTFDQIMITGSYATPSHLNSFLNSKLRRSITDYEQEEIADFLKYFYLTQSQAYHEQTEVSKYILVKPFFQSDVTSLARAELATIDNREVARLGLTILSTIENQLQDYAFATLPPIRVAELENGGVILEWVVDNFRLGFGIEINLEKSGYFLVSNELAGEIRSSGYLKGLRLESVIQSLLALVLNNWIAYG